MFGNRLIVITIRKEKVYKALSVIVLASVISSVILSKRNDISSYVDSKLRELAAEKLGMATYTHNEISAQDSVITVKITTDEVRRVLKLMTLVEDYNSTYSDRTQNMAFPKILNIRNKFGSKRFSYIMPWEVTFGYDIKSIPNKTYFAKYRYYPDKKEEVITSILPRLEKLSTRLKIEEIRSKVKNVDSDRNVVLEKKNDGKQSCTVNKKEQGIFSNVVNAEDAGSKTVNADSDNDNNAIYGKVYDEDQSLFAHYKLQDAFYSLPGNQKAVDQRIMQDKAFLKDVEKDSKESLAYFLRFFFNVKDYKKCKVIFIESKKSSLYE